ncbi:COR domain-containing protein [Prosthecobacter sp. SYSU 5D2]|uniref:COR domain-containing protein n=1 Tax=Prosthecobacter sp. SYSU 5D2 TaxID=3134134 RepID=UPI0031FE9C1F
MSNKHKFSNAQAAYDEALRRIEKCRQQGKNGTVLNLGGLGLTALPPEIGQLTSLTELELSHNQLTSLPPEIGLLNSLRQLDLDNNQLSSLPPEIGLLTSLTWLFLSYNPLTRLPPELCRLRSLVSFFLECTELQELPLFLHDLKNLEMLILHGNAQLDLPDEVLGADYFEFVQGEKPASPQEILAYYFAQRGGVKRPLNEVKVLVVGESEVGKTSIIRQLRGEKHNPKEDKTHGIERHRLSMDCGRLGRVRLNVWDFGGQDIMHATHQFFLTHRSVYVLVLDSRQNERQTRMDYWLKLIASYGGDSPVIIVCNKADQQVMQLNWTGLQKDHPQIKGFVKEVCCYHCEKEDRRKGLDELRQLIAQTVEQHVEGVDQPLLKTWLDLKDALETDGRPYLTLDEYHLLAKKSGIADRQHRDILLSLMHQLGSVLHFSEHAIFEKDRARNATTAQVEELNVLDPGWVTGAIYKLLNDAELIRAGGRMDRASMARSLAELEGRQYPGTKQDFIIAMMRRFEICFPFDGETDRWFLPDLLNKDEVDTGNWAGAMAFRYQYQVLPGSIISRLMVRLHSHIARHCLWRTGAKFKKAPCEALVRSDEEKAQVDICVRGGSKSQRQAFLALICGTLEDIHRSWSGHLPVEAQLPLPKHPDVYVGYEKYLQLEGKEIGRHQEMVNGLLEEIEVTTVLNQVSQRPQRNKEREKRRPKDEMRQGRASKVENHFHAPVQFGDKIIHDNSIHARDILHSQVAQTMENCNNLIQQHPDDEVKTLLESLTKDVEILLACLEQEPQEEAATHLELLTEAVTCPTPNRGRFTLAAKGLRKCVTFVKDFTGDIATTLENLRQILWP